MTGETQVMREIQKQVTADPGVRLFRNNTGTAYQGRMTELAGRRVLLDPREIKFGLVVGGSDLIGWRSITITPDMVGKCIAVFTGIEVKRPAGRAATEAQALFLAAVRRAGGIGEVARSPDEARRVLMMGES